MPGEIISVPIFPLPDTVLFPHTILPLHIFEPRYKEMMTDVLASSGLIGIVQLKPGWDEDYYGTPLVHRIIGVGRIIDHDRLDDGRYDVVISGLHRTQLRSEDVKGLYRIAEVEILPDELPPDSERELSEVHDLLLQIFHKLADALPEGYSLLPHGQVQDLSPGGLVDVMASLLVDDPYERQSLLAETNVLRRQQLLRVQIRRMFNGAFLDPEA